MKLKVIIINIIEMYGIGTFIHGIYKVKFIRWKQDLYLIGSTIKCQGLAFEL